TDDPASGHYKFSFPANTMLGPGQYLLVFADSSGTSGLHLGFTLGANGAALYLYDSVANGGALLDSIKFGLQVEDISIGRLADGSWGMQCYTLGEAIVGCERGYV